MSISVVPAVLGALIFASVASAQPTGAGPDAVSGIGGLFVGSFRVVDVNNSVYGGWLDISFKGWTLGTVEVDLLQNRERRSRVDACPYDDCSPRYASDSDGKVRLISDPNKVAAPATESQRVRVFSVAVLRRFRATRHAAPHFLVGFGRLSRELSFDYDNPAFGQQKYDRDAWGPVGGLGLDLFAGPLVARIQYRLDPMYVGQECVLICNNQFRIGAGWAF